MRPCVVLAALTTFVLAGDVEGQIQIDFSGQWVASAAGGGRGNAAPTAGSGWGPAFSILQRSDTLIVERIFFSPRVDLQPPLKFRYPLDGSTSDNTIVMGRGFQTQTSRASWDGDALVIVTVHSDEGANRGQGVTSEVTHRLSLQEGRLIAIPASLVVETTRSSAMGGQASTTRTVYTRR